MSRDHTCKLNYIDTYTFFCGGSFRDVIRCCLEHGRKGCLFTQSGPPHHFHPPLHFHSPLRFHKHWSAAFLIGLNQLQYVHGRELVMTQQVSVMIHNTQLQLYRGRKCLQLERIQSEVESFPCMPACDLSNTHVYFGWFQGTHSWMIGQMRICDDRYLEDVAKSSHKWPCLSI